MDQTDEQWIKDSLADKTADTDGADFEGEIFLSTDGKHTVRAKSDTVKGREAAKLWVKTIFSQILLTYGTKQAQAVKEYAKEPPKEDLGKCSKCGAPNDKSKKGNIYCSARCWLSK